MNATGVSPSLTLRSAYHRVWFELSETVRWSRGNYGETASGTLPLLKSSRYHRVLQLQRRYEVKFEQQLQSRIAVANYEYLDMLDQASQTFRWTPIKGQELVDIGSQNFYYALALDTVFRPKKLIGVELEGYRVYSDGYSRYDYAQHYTSFVPHAEYLPMDFCRFQGSADAVTCFFPFVTAEALIAWRLPLKVFQPSNLFSNMMTRLRPGGTAFMVNHGEHEARIAFALAEQQGFTRLGKLSYAEALLDRAMPPILSLWKKPT